MREPFEYLTSTPLGFACTLWMLAALQALWLHAGLYWPDILWKLGFSNRSRSTIIPGTAIFIVLVEIMPALAIRIGQLEGYNNSIWLWIATIALVVAGQASNRKRSAALCVFSFLVVGVATSGFYRFV